MGCGASSGPVPPQPLGTNNSAHPAGPQAASPPSSSAPAAAPSGHVRRPRTPVAPLPDFRVDVGTSLKNFHSLEAATAAAKLSVKNFAPGDKSNFAIAFVGGQHNRDQVLEGFRSVLGSDCVIFGGCTPGIVCSEFAQYQSWEIAIVAFPSCVPAPQIVSVAGLTQDGKEIEMGRQLGQKLKTTARDGDTVILFYNSVRSDAEGSAPPSINTGTFVLNGIYETLGDVMDLKIVGAGLLADCQLRKRSYILNGKGAEDAAIAALILPAQFETDTMIMHGCKPLSEFLEITKIEGVELLELDHRPALDVILELSHQSDVPFEDVNVTLSVSLGTKGGDPYEEFDESKYSTRLILKADPVKRSVVMFEADYKVGQQVQIMHRDNDLMLQSAQARGPMLLDLVKTKRPILAFYIDCAGRQSAFSGSEVEEGDVTRGIIGPKLPMIGIYGGVEIAQNGQSRATPLNWTGVMTVLSLRR